MKKLTLASVAAAVLAPGFAIAGPGGNSCATAEEVFPWSEYSGDTTGGANPIGAFGPLPSPSPDAIYKFTSDGQASTPFLVTAASFDSAIFLLSTCGGDAGTPIQAAQGNPPYYLPIDNGSGGPLIDGTTYYVVVSGNPANASGPSGTFTFSTPRTPVTLQAFSIE